MSERRDTLGRRIPVRHPTHNRAIGLANRANGVGASETKVCPRCKVDKLRSEYTVRQNGHTDSYCPPCNKEYSNTRARKYRAAHPEIKGRYRRHYRKVALRKYGITPAQYDEMLASQGGHCAICKGGPGRSRKHFDVDHCHSTGKVRALLCRGCNTGIGSLMESPLHLRAAAEYIERHRQQAVA